MNQARGLTRNRLGATWVRDVDELLDEGRVLLVVPVRNRDDVVLVISVLLLGRVKEERGAQTVDVLTLYA